MSGNDVIITDTMDTSEGLQVTFYVRQTTGVLSGAALADAVQVGNCNAFLEFTC